MMSPPTRWLGLGVGLAVTACGGAAPMMHPAHTLPQEQVTVGAGFSGQIAIDPAPLDVEDVDGRIMEAGAVSPGLAPWVAGRMGLPDNFEVGVTYTGRSARVDGRRAFLLDGPDGPALSLGLGASALLPKRRDELDLRMGGGGADVPILFGIRSDADLYAAWIGARVGFEILNGQREFDQEPLDNVLPIIEEIDGWHVQTGGVIGFRVGFRYIFAVLELDGAMHWAEGSIANREVVLQQFTLSPGGALVGRF